MSVLSVAAWAASAGARAASPTLAVEAMRDRAGYTHVSLELTVDGGRAPTMADEIGVQALDSSSRELAARHESEFPLKGRRAVATTSFRLDQPTPEVQQVSARIAWAEPQTGARTVLEAQAPVRLRPDLRIHSVHAPATAAVGQRVEFTVMIDEANGQLGAVTELMLRSGGTVLTQSGRVSVAAGATRQVKLATTFNAPGRRTLTVGTHNVRPGDYDGRNNHHTFTIEVAGGAPAAAAQLAAEYEAAVDREMLSEWEEAGVARGLQVLTGSHETFMAELSELPTVTSGQVDRVVVTLGGDGAWAQPLRYEAVELSAYGDSVALAPRTTLTITPGDGAYAPGDPVAGLSVKVVHAPGDYVWLFEHEDLVTGVVTHDDFAPADVLLLPAKTADVRLLVTLDGKTYGGTIRVPLRREPVEYEDRGGDEEYWWDQYDSFQSVHGRAEAAVSP